MYFVSETAQVELKRGGVCASACGPTLDLVLYPHGPGPSRPPSAFACSLLMYIPVCQGPLNHAQNINPEWCHLAAAASAGHRYHQHGRSLWVVAQSH